MKKIFKMFFSPMESQGKWLNQKAAKGLRLVDVGRFFYTFESCKPNEYQYTIDYVGNKSYKELEEYQQFLEEMEIKYYERPLNIGQFSWGRAKFRPYANKGGKVAISKGMINRELLILEKKNNGKPFEIYSNIEDKIYQLKEMRKPLIYIEVFILLFAIMALFVKNPVFEFTLWSFRLESMNNNYLLSGLLGIIFLYLFIKLIQINDSIRVLINRGRINE